MARQNAVLAPTPTEDALPRRFADFGTLGEALDYAAMGERGFNFHDARGALKRAYRFGELRIDALSMAHRLIAAGIAPGDRVALIAETCAEFAASFFGAIYAGAWPVPLPLPTSFGGRDAYIDQIRVQLGSSDPKMVLSSTGLHPIVAEAAAICGVEALDWTDVAGRDVPEGPLPKADPDDVAYLQYSSGSTRFPHGVAVTHRGLLNNLAAHSHGMEVIRQRSLHFLAALVSRHGAGRLLPLADRQPGIGGLSCDRGFRPPPAFVAGSHQPQCRHKHLLFPDLRL